MTYLLFLPVVIATLFIFIQVFHFKKLKAHVEHAYPSEWEKVCANPMKTSLSKAISVNLQESILNGYLSTQNDPLISNFHHRNKIFTAVSFLFVIVQLAVVFLE